MNSTRCLCCANTSPAARYHAFKSIFRGELTLTFNSKSALRTNLLNAEFLRVRFQYSFSMQEIFSQTTIRKTLLSLRRFPRYDFDVRPVFCLAIVEASQMRSSRLKTFV